MNGRILDHFVVFVQRTEYCRQNLSVELFLATVSQRLFYYFPVLLCECVICFSKMKMAGLFIKPTLRGRADSLTGRLKCKIRFTWPSIQISIGHSLKRRFFCRYSPRYFILTWTFSRHGLLYMVKGIDFMNYKIKCMQHGLFLCWLSQGKFIRFLTSLSHCSLLSEMLHRLKYEEINKTDWAPLLEKFMGEWGTAKEGWGSSNRILGERV